MPLVHFHPRLTVRRLMILVAIVGLLVGCGIEGERRRMDFRLRQINHYLCQEEAERARRIFSTPVVLDPARVAGFDARIAHHGRMAEKYKWAERYPWLPVLPDPPEPK
jgi:hypothetical protein